MIRETDYVAGESLPLRRSYDSLNSAFTTLPYAVRGRASTKMKSRGSLYLASLSARKLLSSSAEGIVELEGTTKATPTSPHFRSDAPMTAASRTAGHRSNSASISTG